MGLSALVIVRRVAVVIAAGGLTVVGCGSETAGRTMAEPISASAPTPTDTKVAVAEEPAATELPIVAGEPSWDQDKLERESPVAAPSTTPTVEATLDDDDSSTTGAVGDSEPPELLEHDVSDEENAPDDTPLASDPDFPPQAEDVVVIESFNVKECVMRGMLHNQSDSLFARDVVLIIESPDRSKKASWHWPLMMLPGERAPFEININWSRNELAATTPSNSQWMEPYDLAQSSWSSIWHTVTATFSEKPDVSRSFSWNADGTEDYNLFQSFQNYLVYDDRVFESEDWYEFRYRGGRGIRLLHRHKFELVYPNYLVISNDLDPILSEFQPYDFTDIYYTPEISPPTIRYQTPEIPYQKFYDPVNDQTAKDVKVYQAILGPGGVLDVRELILHTVVEEISPEGRIVDRTMTPISELVNYDSGTAIPVYVRVTTPDRIDNPPGDNWDYEGKVWIGIAGQGDPFADSKDVSQVLSSGRQGRDIPRGTCDLPGGLAVQDFMIQSNSGIAGQVFNIPLGYFGTFDAFEPSQEAIDDVIVEDETIAIIDGVIRGLVHNLSADKFARDVTVTAVPKDGSEDSASWQWPLTLQPGERAPFEIIGWNGVSDPEAFSFQVSVSFSEQVDISRAFRVERSNNFGYVYKEDARELYNREKYQNSYPGNYRDYNVWLGQDRNYLLWDEFEKIYLDVLTPDLDSDVAKFEYSEIYASVVRADSHPSLDGKIDTQVIDELKAYRAIFNSNMEVVEVYELIPFTSVYSSNAPNNRRLMPVNVVPTPNGWTPKTVQMLLVSPMESEEDTETYYSSQVWIGGTS